MSVQKYSKTENGLHRSSSEGQVVKMQSRYYKANWKRLQHKEDPRRMRLDDIKQWTQINTYEDIKRLAQDRCQCSICTVACQPSDLEDDS